LPKPDKIVGQMESGLTGVYCILIADTILAESEP